MAIVAVVVVVLLLGSVSYMLPSPLTLGNPVFFIIQFQNAYPLDQSIDAGFLPHWT
jgi:hypothetical protein